MMCVPSCLQTLVALLLISQHNCFHLTRSAPSKSSALSMTAGFWSRRDMLSSASVAAVGLLARGQSAVAEDVTPIEACVKPAGGATPNCLSTASVRQLDLYAAPWTYPDGMSASEVKARLKGAISTNAKLSIVDEGGNYVKVSAIRGFSSDEVRFVINPDDRIITYSSKQVDGPDVSDFGEQRKRLDDLRRRVKVFGVMGEEFETPQEGALGQLKAFYGLRSGAGFESLILDLDEE